MTLSSLGTLFAVLVLAQTMIVDLALVLTGRPWRYNMFMAKVLLLSAGITLLVAQWGGR